jgi:ribosome biogenesis protein MAK21
VDKDKEEFSERKKRQDRFYRALYATLAKSNVVCRGKHLTMYFNLVYKAMKYDTDANRVHAFAKRLLTTVLHAPPSTVAASIFLLQEISRTHNDLRLSWEDVPDPDLNAPLVLDDTRREPKAGIVHMKILYRDGGNDVMDEGAESVGPPPCWELSLIAHHFHPSVTKFASDIGEIDYAGDPLHDFGLGPFLDKFAYRNPKSREKLIQQYRQAGITGAASSHGRRMRRLEARLELPRNDPRLLDRNEISEQDEFFHRFFVERARRDEIKGIARHHVAEEEAEFVDEQEELVLDTAEEAHEIVGGKSFEEYEAMWETDEEEEAFVDSLATQLLEDASGGPADFDDDPDMEDWKDMYADEEGNDKEPREEDHEGVADGDGLNEADLPSSDDAISEVDESTNENGYDDSGSEPEIDKSAVVGRCDVELVEQGCPDDNEDDSQAHASDSNSRAGDDDVDDDEEFRMFFLADDSDDEVPQDSNQSSKRRRLRSKESPAVFADADEYAEVIERSFLEMKRTSTSSLSSVDAGRGTEAKPRQNATKRRKH